MALTSPWQEAPRPHTSPWLDGPRATPRQSRTGHQTTSYESKFGTADILRPSPREGGYATPTPTPRAAQRFTDPKNPFARDNSKKMVPVEASRDDRSRAGQRTRNPGVIPHASGSDRAADSKTFTVPCRYSTGPDYKPGKQFGRAKPGSKESPIAQPDTCYWDAATVTAVGPAKIHALSNYLNDMKKTSSSRRMAAGGTTGPSHSLQLMNDRKVKLGSEMRDESRERGPPERRSEAGVVPTSPRQEEALFARKRRQAPSSAAGVPTRSPSEPTLPLGAQAASLHLHRVGQQESVENSMLSDNCGSARPESARMAGGGFSNSQGQFNNILTHAEDFRSCSQRRTESLNRKQRTQQADARGEEIKQHMRSHSASQRNFETYRDRGIKGSGSIFPASEGRSESVPPSPCPSYTAAPRELHHFEPPERMLFSAASAASASP